MFLKSMPSWFNRITCFVLMGALLGGPMTAHAMVKPESAATTPTNAIQSAFAWEAVIPAIRCVHTAIISQTFQQIRTTAALISAVIGAGAWHPVLAQGPGGAISPKQERSTPGRITNTYMVGLETARMQAFIKAFDSWLEKTLAGLEQQPGLSQTNREDFHQFAESARNHVYVQGGNGAAAGVHFSPTDPFHSNGMTLNMARLEPMLQSAAKGNAAARTELLTIGIRSGAVIRENGGNAFFQFLKQSRGTVTQRAPGSLPALEALQTVIQNFGVTLSVNPGQGSSGSMDIDFSQTLPDQVEMNLQTTIDYSIFKTLVLQSVESQDHDLFLGIVMIKEGGGAVDMIARPAAYRDLFQEALRFALAKFKNQSLDTLDPKVGDEALKDTDFIRMVYEHTARLMYAEAIGGEEYLSFTDAIDLNDSKIEAIQKKYPSPEIQSLTKRALDIRKSVNGKTGLDRTRSLRREALWDEVSGSFYYGFMLIIRDQVHQGRMHPEPKTKRIEPIAANKFALDFLLTDPAFTHENDYRLPTKNTAGTSARPDPQARLLGTAS